MRLGRDLVGMHLDVELKSCQEPVRSSLSSCRDCVACCVARTAAGETLSLCFDSVAIAERVATIIGNYCDGTHTKGTQDVEQSAAAFFQRFPGRAAKLKGKAKMRTPLHCDIFTISLCVRLRKRYATLFSRRLATSTAAARVPVSSGSPRCPTKLSCHRKASSASASCWSTPPCAGECRI